MADSPAAEIRIDEILVRTLLREQAPDLAEEPLTLVAEGWDNAIWRLGDELAVRLPRRRAAAALIRHEQQHLPAMGARLAAQGGPNTGAGVRGAPRRRIRVGLVGRAVDRGPCGAGAAARGADSLGRAAGRGATCSARPRDRALPRQSRARRTADRP
ncbi:hypothetical protein GCM10023171_14050 [Microbacterium panaciterrae]|uniref:Aminoglycoside phosphotransferase domain-containing protein n=1 Tax=Microbacterium panaciterrae TaxID=985759 RepID=A0ABP8P9W3_9MICO